MRLYIGRLKLPREITYLALAATATDLNLASALLLELLLSTAARAYDLPNIVD